MPNTINQWVAYLSNDKAELNIQDIKSVVRGGPKNRKYWNLHAVVMSDCSLIATQNSHAKNNISVVRIPRGAEHRQSRVAHQRHDISSERRSKKFKILELTACSHVGLFVHSHPKFTCQTQSISGLHTWAPTEEELDIKVIQWVVRGGQINANIRTYAL